MLFQETKLVKIEPNSYAHKTNYNRIKRSQKRAYNANEKHNLTKLGKPNPREFGRKIKQQYKKIKALKSTYGWSGLT